MLDSAVVSGMAFGADGAGNWNGTWAKLMKAIGRVQGQARAFSFDVPYKWGVMCDLGKACKGGVGVIGIANPQK